MSGVRGSAIRRATPAVVCAAALLPATLAGCGSGSGAPSVAGASARTTPSTARGESAPSPGGSPTQRLIVYSACMRRNGVPSFPQSEQPRQSDHHSERAQDACKKFSPESETGVGVTPAQHARAEAALTRYVHCMRKHDVEMPGPFSGPNGGVGIALPRRVDPSSPLYENEDSACNRFIPNGG